MNKTIISLLALLLLGVGQVSATTTVTLQEALSMVKAKFAGRDVDFYEYIDPREIHETIDSVKVFPRKALDGGLIGIGGAIAAGRPENFWKIFVDANPTAGWSHTAYMYYVWKECPTDASPIQRISDLTCPPAGGEILPLSVKNRGGNSPMPDAFDRGGGSIDANKVNEKAANTHAIIISGGYNKYFNYRRYWNDCSFIYQTLRKTYGVPKENIALFMADGNDPEADMRTGVSSYASSPLDLDYDGVDDLEMAATNANISAHLAELASTLTEDDHLFVYVIDHGGTDGGDDAFIYLWGGEKLTDASLAEQLKPITDNYVAVNVLLGQCNAGGFVDDLEPLGCVVTTACGADEESYATSDGNFDNFVYNWTCAVNGCDPYEAKVDADADGNGYVSMREAFLYADSRSTRPGENPQHASKPVYLAYDLAFSNIPPSVDLYMRDSEDDYGLEPSPDEKYWKSPDLWVRNQKDGEENQFSQIQRYGQTSAYIYARVTNRGRKPYTKGTQTILQFYWSEMSLSPTISTWMGYEFNGEFSSGGKVGHKNIVETIPPGESVIISKKWNLEEQYSDPDSIDEENPEIAFFSLLARIETDTEFGRYDEKWKTAHFEVREERNTIQNTRYIINGPGNPIIVWVRRNMMAQEAIAMDIVACDFDNSAPVMSISVPQSFYSAWQKGGEVSQNLDYASTNGLDHRFEFAPRMLDGAPGGAAGVYEKTASLSNIMLDTDELVPIKVNFSFRNLVPDGKEYEYEIIQRDENGNVTGGVTFVVKNPTSSNRLLGLTVAEHETGFATVAPDTDTDGYNMSWTDSKGQEISKAQSITVRPTPADHEFTLTAISPDGEMARASVTLDVTDGIKSVAVHESALDVEFYGPVSASEATLTITSAINPNVPVVTTRLAPGIESATLGLDTLPAGVYVLTYSANGTVVDSYKFTRK